LCPQQDENCISRVKEHCPDLDKECLDRLSQMDYYLVGRENFTPPRDNIDEK
jgi:hypothetical protein